MFERRRFLRNFEGGQYLDLMLVVAVSTVLLIRFSLVLADYPHLGGEALHIAHMLWGGLLMLVALVLLFSFVDRGVLRLAAFLGGAGFGTFIDEVGKFVTHDNDYFYSPAVSIIYAVFVLLYLAVRSLHRGRATAPQEYIANALQEVTEIAVGDLDERERDRALHYLEQSGADFPLVRSLRQILEEARLVTPPAPGTLARLLHRLLQTYRRLSVTSVFARALVAFFVIQLLVKLGRLTALAHLLPANGARFLRIPLVSSLPVDTASYDLAQWFQLGTSFLSAAFVGIGVVYVFRNRLRALRMFQRSILVSIFLTQVFVFYRVEWLGLGELVFNLLVFVALRFVIEHEQRWTETAA